jgi:uncharacterized protein (UPF0332 family)
MYNFLEKSEQSLESANILVKQSFHSSTVNRAYYACIQFLMHTLFTKLKYDKNQFYVDVRNSSDGTHGWASKLIGIELAKIDMDDFKWFQRTIKEFKKVRVQADYHETVISHQQGYDSITTAKTVINTVKKNFK